jgi:hypothetical protein
MRVSSAPISSAISPLSFSASVSNRTNSAEIASARSARPQTLMLPHAIACHCSPLRLDLAWHLRDGRPQRTLDQQTSAAMAAPGVPSAPKEIMVDNTAGRELSGLDWVVRCPRRLSGVRSGHEVRDIHSRRAAQ